MTTSPPTLRAFVAVGLPTEAQEGLARLLESLRGGPNQGLRWVDPLAIHLTLQFLGDLSGEQVDSVTQALQEAVADHAAFALRFGELGAFPSLSRPRILWLGLEGDLDALQALQQEVKGRLRALGFPSESRPFAPHLTLARVRQGRPTDVRALTKRVHPSDHMPDTPIPVDAVTLMQSTLRPQGASYTPLWRGRLA